MLNALHDMKGSPGLQAIQVYEAEVVDNNDPKKLCRIRARVAEMFEGISDDELPWAIPSFSHVDGATDTSGIQFVPKKKSKIFITFQGGNPLFPIWHNYHVDEKTKLQEMEYNYPDRAVVRFQNKALLVMDTKDNELMIRNPGTLKVYIEGNVELEIKGNLEEKIHGNVTRKILGNLSESIVGNCTRKIEGNLDDSLVGNYTHSVVGTLNETITGASKFSFSTLDVTISGTKKESIAGAYSCTASAYNGVFSGAYQLQTSAFNASLGSGTVGAGQLTLAGSQTTIVGAGGLTFMGSAINFQKGGSVPTVSVTADSPSSPTSPSVPADPTLTEWKGIRGGASG